jgi:hypothetical protein
MGNELGLKLLLPSEVSFVQGSWEEDKVLKTKNDSRSHTNAIADFNLCKIEPRRCSLSGGLLQQVGLAPLMLDAELQQPHPMLQ